MICRKKIAGDEKQMETRITRDERGTYRWLGTIDRESDKKTIRIIYGVIGGLCILFILMALAVNADMLGVTILTCLGVMAVVTAVALPLMRLSRGRQQPYEMNDEYVRYVGYGREDARFRYEDIRKVRVCSSRNMLEVKGLIVTAPIFVPHEDFGFVRDYILRRLPGNTKVEYD